MNTRTKVLAGLGVGVILIAGVVGASVALNNPSHHSPTASTSSSTSSSTSADTHPDGPNGCMGGSDITTAISTAFTEPKTPKGAIEFTATVQRWLLTSSVGTSTMSSVGARLVNPTTLKVYTDQLSALPSDGSTGYSTQASTAWVKSFDEKKGTATVLFTGQARASRGSQAITQDMSTVVELTTKDGHWFISKQGAGDADHTPSGADKIAHEITAGGGGPLAGGC